MKANNSSPSFVEGNATLLLVVGGTFQAVTECPAAAGADVIVHADVTSELEATARADSVVTLRLAAGETLGTLTQDSCSDALQKLVSQRPGAELGAGLMQCRAIGHLAATKDIAKPTFREFVIRQVLEPLLQMHNGCIEHIRIIILSSTAGGTGSPCGPEIAKAIAGMLLNFTNATVRVELLRVGSLSYASLGDRVHPNGSAAALEDLAFVCAGDRHVREVRSLTVAELPMVGAQKSQRDRYAVGLNQAVSCPEVRTIADRAFPNEALSSTYGAVRVLRASFWKGIEDQEIAREAARASCNRMQVIAETSPMTRVGEEFHVRLDEVEVKDLPTVKEIGDQIRRARGVRRGDLWQQCVQCPVWYEPQAIFTYAPEKDRINLRTLLVADCKTGSELATKVAVLKALDLGLRRELDQRTRPLELARKELSETHKQLRHHFDKFFPESWWSTILAAISNPQTSLVQLQNSVTKVREKARALHRLEKEYKALADALWAVQAELAAEEKRLARGIDLMRAASGEGTLANLVRLGSLDAVIPQLLDEASKCNGEISRRAIRLLASCVREVTLAGLADGVGAPEPRPASIARHLAQGRPTIRGPAWGGKRYLGPVQRVLVLPPLAKEDVTALRDLMAEQDPNLIVACAGTAQGGVHVVLLETFVPRRISDIFTPFHLQYLEKAKEEAHLYFTGSVDPDSFIGNGKKEGRESCD